MIVINVNGVPAPQGSKRAYVSKTGRAVVVEQSGRVAPWREAVRQQTQEALEHTMSGQRWARECLTFPIEVTVHFWLERPRGHYGTGRNAAQVRPSAPLRPASAPDLDKLIRSTLDGLTMGGAFCDDRQVVSISAHKWYAVGSRRPGCMISLEAQGAEDYREAV